jgi:hypothetical protein
MLKLNDFAALSMRRLIVALLVTVLPSVGGLPAISRTHVRGHYKSNGTYVAPHYRSSPNHTQTDNYSTYGNINPFTGFYGTKVCGLYELCR